MSESHPPPPPRGVPVHTEPATCLGPTKHASEAHDDFGDHAETHPEHKDAYRTPAKSRNRAPHASEAHDDFGDHAEHVGQGGYRSPKSKSNATHVGDIPGFKESFSHDGKGGYKYNDQTPRRGIRP